MAIIKPFKGLQYNKKLIRKIGNVVAPPYDVISAKEQNELYRKHSLNIIRLILGKEGKSDNKKSNRYTRAKRLFEKMQVDKALLQDRKPSFYYYTQEYSLPTGEKLARKGFLALLKIADFDEGIVLRHEKILSEPFEDRISLIKECRANFSPIFMLYSDKNRKVSRLFRPFVNGRAYFNFTDKDGIKHRLWKVNDVRLISDVERLFERKALIIADGHHRYSASVRFRDIMRKKTGNGGCICQYKYTMVYLTAMEDKGLSILPIHRLVYGIKDFNRDKILKKLSRDFSIETIEVNKGNMDRALAELKELMFKNKKNVFSLYFRAEKRFFILKPIKNKVKDRFVKSGISSELANLDVVILHRLIFEKILKITRKAQDTQQNIIYVKGNEDLRSILKRKNYQVAFLLHPISSSDVFKIVKQGEILPQKATFFYPKLISGFVINKIN